MEQRSTTTVHETIYIFKLKSDKPPHFSVVFSFLECYSEWPDSLKGTVPRSSAVCFLFKISYSVWVHFVGIIFCQIYTEQFHRRVCFGPNYLKLWHFGICYAHKGTQLQIHMLHHGQGKLTNYLLIKSWTSTIYNPHQAHNLTTHIKQLAFSYSVKVITKGGNVFELLRCEMGLEHKEWGLHNVHLCTALDPKLDPNHAAPSVDLS